ncbi:hypothetical protein D6783_03585 [Candidatus Woesearchaeota archaeon]|nr:MAG: hypothetical protein D6783_03585 [Candidatus Woesearchaeota archaeon]
MQKRFSCRFFFCEKKFCEKKVWLPIVVRLFVVVGKSAALGVEEDWKMVFAAFCLDLPRLLL